MDDIAGKIQSLLSDEESMNQIKELAAMFSGGFSEDGAPPPEQQEDSGGLGIDPFALMQLLGAASAIFADSSRDKDSDLLIALKPHLSEERQKRLDKAVKVLKLYNIFIALRENGMLNDLENLL